MTCGPGPLHHRFAIVPSLAKAREDELQRIVRVLNNDGAGLD
jgi:hypothetical protein